MTGHQHGGDEWLLEPDVEQPAVRYFALRDLLDRPTGDPEVKAAQAAIMATGPVPAILAAQNPDGSWLSPTNPYSTKYRGSSWQVLLLAELGADPADARVRKAGEFVLQTMRAPTGAFGYRTDPPPSAAIYCLNGNLLFALQRLGFGDDPRVRAAFEWLAKAFLGEGVTYFKSTTAGPEFACGINEGQPCGWGAVKAARALAEVTTRTPLVDRARAATAEFLLRHDLAKADFPYTGRISSTWFKFGFPSGYTSDILETADALVALGAGDDPRLGPAVQLIEQKRDPAGRWRLENTLNGKMWQDIERKGQSSKWVTLRALRVLRGVERAAGIG